MRVHDYLEYWASTAPDNVCVEVEERSWTFVEINAWADLIAADLLARGHVQGDRVAVVSENCVEWIAVYYGAFKAGVVPVPLNYRLHPSEWTYIVEDANARSVLAHPDYLSAVDGIRDRLVGVQTYLAFSKASSPYWETLVHPTTSPGPRGAGSEISGDAELYQMYTSGTTGRPKGAVLTHKAINSNIQQTQLVLGLRPGDRSLVVMPLYHAGAAVTSFSVIATGGTVVLRSGFDPNDCVRALSEGNVATATFVPAMIQAMLVEVDDVGLRSYDSLRLMAYGASPIAESTLRQALEIFGCGFVQGYGMTECSSVVALLSPDDHRLALQSRPELLLSVGRPVVGAQVQIVDTDGAELPPGETGEILVRGPQVMREYWNLPEETALALRGGWMHTGDAGSIDDTGFLFVSDRVKDMIVSGGENVYPREIEDVLFEMPGVVDAAVIGVPDDRWGETVKAVVVLLEDGSVTADDVMDWCRSRLGSFKRPRSVDFVDALPRNPSGKVLKRELRDPYWRDRERHVG